MGDIEAWVESAFDLIGGVGWPILAVIAAVVLLLVLRLRGPQPGEFWMADVPFREGGGSKDRPCYVVGRKGRAVRVLYVTSRDRTSDDRYVPVDTSRWNGRVGGRRSWMQIAERGGADPCLYVRRSAFRRCLGRASSGEKAIVASAL